VISSGINPEGIVSFLTMVGAQGWQPLGHFPGFDAPEVRCWPRFRYGNVVLFRRRWVSDASAIAAAEPMTSSRNSSRGQDYFEAVQRWRRDSCLPRHVFVHSEREPKPFYVDLGSVAFVDRLRRELEPPSPPPGRVHVTEMLPAPNHLWVRDAAGRYASEFLIHADNIGSAAPELDG
jgi:hypothetical protein